MQFHTHGNGKGMNDLYILPENDYEVLKLRDWLALDKARYMSKISFSDVKGQPWFGRAFIEIPFGEPMKEEIQEYCKEV